MAAAEFRRVAFARINSSALSNAESLLGRRLPSGKRLVREWVALNPRRADRSLGSFRINLDTGKWADFATNDRGGDLVSLWAYLAGIGQRDAALQLAEQLGVDPYE